MKKLLLCIMAAGLVASSASAQVAGKAPKIREVKPKAELMRNAYRDAATSTPSAARPSVSHPKSSAVNPHAAKVAAVGKIDISTSANAYGNLISEGGLLNYNSDLNVVSYTNRKSIGVTGANYNSGTVQTRFSADNGATWDTTLVVFSNLAPVNRYPQGTIVNPPGNTTVLNAYAAAAAPLLDGTLWDGGSFGSIQLNGANASVTNIVNASATVRQFMPRLGMCSGTNGNAYALADDYDFNAATPYMDGFVVNRGVWNAVNNNLDWDQTLIYHAFSHDPLDDSQNFSTLGNLAFSPDGVTGYVVTLGRDSVCDYLSPMPIVYRTTDAGASWSLYCVKDFSPVFASIYTANGAGTRPFFTSQNGFDVAVDANNKLHILCEVAQATSNDPDSLNFGAFGGFLFDTYEAANGEWGTVFAGQVQTDPPQDNAGTTNPNSLGWAVNWDARAQICVSADGTKAAYIWSDTDPAVTTNNEFPDLFGSSCDFVTGQSTDPINFTLGSAYEANNYWEYVSVKGWDNAGDFVVPVVTSTQLNSGGLDTDPWMHQFVSGIQFAAADYINAISATAVATNCASVGINEVIVPNSTLVYPNPATNNATVAVTMKQSASVSINVMNAVGQVVKTVTIGSTDAGKHAFSFDVADLQTGLYLVNITIGSETITQKLSVQR
ncbi:hypothetical protein BH11BAC2_BH11BAC2_14120 [soil metagenome]